jgi:hypothetical protein
MAAEDIWNQSIFASPVAKSCRLIKAKNTTRNARIFLRAAFVSFRTSLLPRRIRDPFPVLQDLMGGCAGCRGGALTPVPVFPHVASLRGAVRCAGYTGAGSGLALVMLRPGRREPCSTVGRTMDHGSRGSNYQNGPDTPRGPEASALFPCFGTRNDEFTPNVTPCVTLRRYGFRHPAALRFGVRSRTC